MSEDILKYSSRKVGKHQRCCEKLQIKEGRKQQWPTEKEKNTIIYIHCLTLNRKRHSEQHELHTLPGKFDGPEE